MRACVLCTDSIRASIVARSWERSEITFSSARRLSSSRCDTEATRRNASLSPPVRRTRSMIVFRAWLLSPMTAEIACCSAAVFALTRRAAAAEISPEITESRMASVMTGTSRPATCSKPRSVALNDMIATVEAITVITATTPNAICSLTLTPSRVRAEALGSVEFPRSVKEPAAAGLLSIVIESPLPQRFSSAVPGLSSALPFGGEGKARYARLHRQFVDRLEGAVGLNHGHEHLVHAFVLFRAKRHRQAANVELSGVLDDLDEAVAGRARPGLVQRRDREAPDQIALERHELRLGLGVRGLDRRLVVGDHGQRGVPRERHDLRHDHALAVRAQLLGERGRPDERDIDEHRVELDLAGELDELGDRLVGPDHHHGFRLRALEREQGGLHRNRVALVGGFRGKLDAALRHRPLDAVEPGAPERVVLVEDRDLLDLEVFGEVAHPGLGLGAVARADVDDVLELHVAQEAGAGEGADERHLGGGRDRLGRGRGRRADRPDEGEHLVFLDQLLGRHDRAVRLVAVVDADELELAAVHA